jgi:predicted metal-binding membrane protein
MSASPWALPSTGLERAERGLLCAAAAIVTLAAWLWLGGAAGAHDHSSILRPHAGGGGAAAFWTAVLMWQVMTVSMMTPTFLRWLLVFADLAPAGSRRSERLARIALLTGGYMAAWLVYSITAASVQQILEKAGWLREGRVAAMAGGALLVVAGGFQLAPIKRACLAHCRNPLSFFLTRWRGGPSGFRLGAVHGAYCIACCWLLMATGFAMGVMNVAWMAALTLVVVAEQILPRGERVAALLGLAMAAWGLRLLIG